MTRLLTVLFGRLPIGWLQLIHNRARFAAALFGVAFANLLIFMQLGFLGGLVESIRQPYAEMNADILIQAADTNTINDSSPLPRQRLYQALTVPGVASATPVYYKRLDWKQPDGTVRNLDVFGIDPNTRVFHADDINRARPQLQLLDHAIIDRKTRNAPKGVFQRIDSGEAYEFEANNLRRLTVTGTFAIGGGFTADGYLIVSDQTFFRLFKDRVPGAPNFVFVTVQPNTPVLRVVDALRASLPASDSAVYTVAEAVKRDQRFQTSQKPVGIIFGFGVAIGVLVGIIIVYQVLSTDVADHIREYATFKAIGYRQRFFLGIVFEEALILALFGFVPGVLAALGLYAAVVQVTGLPVFMPLDRPIFVLLGTIAMCTLSGALATRRLAKADPADLF
jgi:putative ABC transport system permease protein